MNDEIASLNLKNKLAKEKEECMRQKIKQKEQMYETSEAEINVISAENKKVEGRIEEVCQEIKKV